MRRLIVALTFLLVAAGTALAGAYFALSPRYLAAEIEKAVFAATGRTAVLSSRPGLSLWPDLTVTFDGISLANPPGMAEGVFADVGRVELKMKAATLVRGKVDVQRVTLVRPRLNLAIDSEGRVNWSMPGAGVPASAAGASAGEVNLPIFIEDGTVAFRDLRSGQAASVENLDLTLKLASLRGPVECEGHADWRGERARLALFVKSPQEVADAGSAFDLNLSTSRLTLEFNGHGAARRGIELAGQLDIKSSSIGELLGLTGAAPSPGPRFGPLEAKGALTVSKGMLALKKARLAFDGMKADGDISVELSQPTPRINARLAIDRLDIDRYAPFRAPSAEAEGEGVDAWSSLPIDFSGLRAFDAAAVLTVGDLRYGGLAARDVTLETSLTGGVLDTKLRDIRLLDGRASGQVVLNGARKMPIVQASFQGRGLDGHRLLMGYVGFDGIEGMAEIAVAVAAQGQNESEMIASLRGSAGFSFTGGAIRGVDIASIMRGLAKNPRSGWAARQGERTDFSLLKADFTLSDGVAENKDLQLLGPVVRMNGAGNVDLLRRELDFRVEPRLAAGREARDDRADRAGSGPPVIVRGPWAKPTIAPEATQ